MSDVEAERVEQENVFDEADSKADAIAIFALIAIAVCGMIYFVS